MKKSWYKSVGIWGGIITLAGVAYAIATGDTATAEKIIFSGLGISVVGIRRAIA